MGTKVRFGRKIYMDKIKILHFADIHFDTPFSDLSVSIAEERKEDLRETFGKIIDKAIESKVDIILAAGDLFDNTTVMKTTLDYMIKKFNEAKDIKIFISPGNHDPYNNKSFYNLVKWPDNVHIFKEEYEAVEIEELNTIVHGIGFSKLHERTSLLKGIKASDKNYINLMVMHGDISSNGNNDYNPFTLQEIGESNMDYLALGHRHSFSGILRERDTHYAYSGNPEGRGFDETSEKGIIMGEVSKGRVNLAFYPIQKRKYYVSEIDITGADNYEYIVDTILNTLREYGENNLFKIILKGEIDEYFLLNKGILHNKLDKIFYYVKLIDNTTIKIDLENISDKFTLKGIYAKKLLQNIKEETDEDYKILYEEALKLGFQALSGGEIKIK